MNAVTKKTRRFKLPLIAVLLAVAASAAAGGWWLKHAAAPQTDSLACSLPADKANAPHPGMVWVPPGSLVLGDTVYPEEQPAGKVSVAGFWMDRSEVSNDAFAAFVKATGYVTVAEQPVDLKLHTGLTPEMQQPGAVVFSMPDKINNSDDVRQWWRYVPGADWRHPGGPATSIEGHGAFPVVHVTYADALAYAKWKGTALPSEAQWEWAARGAQPQAAPEHAQPLQANTWQGLFPVANSGDDGYIGLAPSGCYAPNALGLFDMIGNVWELTSDVYLPFHQGENASHDQLPPELQNRAGGQRTIKGGSYLCAPNYCMRYRSAARQPQDEDLAVSHLGFRTVLSAPAP
jgi:formylglycine-generating enzyme required for sulfatase activity